MPRLLLVVCIVALPLFGAAFMLPLRPAHGHELAQLVTPTPSPTAAQVVTMEQAIGMIHEEQRQTRLTFTVILSVIGLVLLASLARVR